MISLRCRTIIVLAVVVPTSTISSGCRLPHLLGPSHPSLSTTHRNQDQSAKSTQPPSQENAIVGVASTKNNNLPQAASNQLSPEYVAGPQVTNYEVASHAAIVASPPPVQMSEPAQFMSESVDLSPPTVELAGYSSSNTSPPNAHQITTLEPENSRSLAGAANGNSDGSTTPPTRTPQPNIQLQIENVRPQRGQVKVAVFTSPDKFPEPDGVSQTFELGSATDVVTASLSIDKPCAIAVFQDIDGDGRLSKNRRGIPVEPCAFSNNAVIKRGPPKFSEAMVQPGTGSAVPTKVSIRLP